MRRSFGAIALVVGFAAVFVPSARAAAEAGQIRQADRHCQTGLKALQAGNYEKAREAFAKAFSVVPDFPPAHLGMGHVALAEKDYSGALDQYRKAAESWSSMGKLLEGLEMERWSKAQDEIRRLEDEQRQLANRERGPDAAGGLSTNQQNLGRTIDSRIQQLQAIPRPIPQEDPEPPADIYFHIGNAAFRLERYEDARTAWERCAEMNPKFPLVRNNLAVLYLKAGRYDDAREAVAAAEQLGMTVNPALKQDIERAAAQHK